VDAARAGGLPLRGLRSALHNSPRERVDSRAATATHRASASSSPPRHAPRLTSHFAASSAPNSATANNETCHSAVGATFRGESKLKRNLLGPKCARDPRAPGRRVRPDLPGEALERDARRVSASRRASWSTPRRRPVGAQERVDPLGVGHGAPPATW
jgi:hypothetical protein